MSEETRQPPLPGPNRHGLGPVEPGAGPLRARRDLSDLVKQSAAAYAALSSVDQAIVQVRQRASYVRGEMGMPDGKLGGLSEDKIAALPRDPGSVLADEVERLRKALAAATCRVYFGEVRFPFRHLDGTFNDSNQMVTVPWTTIKLIMALIEEAVSR